MTSNIAAGSGNSTDSSYDATFRTASGETDIREVRRELWSFLSGEAATAEYSLDNVSVDVPETTGPDAPRATWKLQGTVRIRTDDDVVPGPLSSDRRRRNRSTPQSPL